MTRPLSSRVGQVHDKVAAQLAYIDALDPAALRVVAVVRHYPVRVGDGLDLSAGVGLKLVVSV